MKWWNRCRVNELLLTAHVFSQHVQGLGRPQSSSAVTAFQRNVKSVSFLASRFCFPILSWTFSWSASWLHIWTRYRDKNDVMRNLWNKATAFETGYITFSLQRLLSSSCLAEVAGGLGWIVVWALFYLTIIFDHKEITSLDTSTTRKQALLATTTASSTSTDISNNRQYVGYELYRWSLIN